MDLALATMTGIATNINNMKRKNEDAVRVQEIQSQLYGWTGADLTALGELIAEGTFRVGGARGKRHVFLFDKVLLIAKSKGDGTLAYKNHIDVRKVTIFLFGNTFSINEFLVFKFDASRTSER